MEKEMNAQPENVISLFARNDAKNSPDLVNANALNESQSAEDIFAQAKKKNEEASDRLRKERAKANRSVLRSYRIKS